MASIRQLVLDRISLPDLQGSILWMEEILHHDICGLPRIRCIFLRLPVKRIIVF